MRCLRLFVMAVLLGTVSSVHADDWEESAEIGRLFESAGVEGTFVLYDVSAGRYIGHDRGRAETRYIPASTYKIPHTLIGLATGAVAGVDEVLPYGGEPQPFEVWEKDMSLRDAIVISNVAIYRELARRIGLDRMQAQVSRLSYGNARIGETVDGFWLHGPLKISAVEQTRFLAALAQGRLPFPARMQDDVREIVRLEQRGESTLYGKTGWENAPGPGVGWWVGWVDKDGRPFAFALNLDIQKSEDADKRVELGKASLSALGIF